MKIVSVQHPCIPTLHTAYIEPSELTNARSTESAFEACLRWQEFSPDWSPYDAASTRLLIQALHDKRLTWRQLAALVYSKINYGAIYGGFDNDRHECLLLPGEYNKTPMSGSPFLPLTDPQSVEVFIAFVDDLTRYILGAQSRMPPQKRAYLWAWIGNGINRWKAVEYKTGLAFHSYAKMKSAYEASLLESPSFRSDFEEALKEAEDEGWFGMLDEKRWLFTSKSWSFFTSINDCLLKDSSCLKVANGIPPVSLILFCKKYGIEILATDPEKGMLKGFNFGVQRVELVFNNVRRGFNVFIPAHYRFSHINNYRDTDFAVLKDAMGENESAITLARKKPKSLEEKKRYAKRKRRQLRNDGRTPLQAWELVRREMAWAKSTMRKHCGSQPKPTAEDTYGS